MTSTNGYVQIQVRGRVLRNGVQDRSRSSEKRKVCLLSDRGGKELEMWGIGQPCFGAKCCHTHITRIAANRMYKEGIIRFVGQGRNVAAYAYARTWKGVPSGPERMKVMQLV